MDNFCFDNIDLFYYHSTDIDFSRLYSIINSGIVSKNHVLKQNVSYYHRNYVNSSSKDDYVSVSTFCNPIFQYYHLKNELYERSRNKIIFVIDRNIDALTKQSYYRRGVDTPERHIKNFIDIKNIVGIVIRKIDYEKSIKDIPFIMDYSDFNGTIKKCFDTINFFEQVHNYKKDITELYCMFGMLLENKVLEKEESDNIIYNIKIYMENYIFNAYEYILKIKNPKLKDVIHLYVNSFNIYVMNKFDIKKEEELDKLVENEEEIFHKKYPLAQFKRVSKKEIVELKKDKKIRISQAILEMQMRISDQNIYIDNYHGPLTNESEKIKEKILAMK